MEDIFEGAKFGDIYSTRDGRKAVYVGTNQLGGICSSQEFADPEDAIVDIIEYLVKNDLIK